MLFGGFLVILCEGGVDFLSCFVLFKNFKKNSESGVEALHTRTTWAALLMHMYRHSLCNFPASVFLLGHCYSYLQMCLFAGYLS